MMNICLINNYNYARFLEQALRSALDQDIPFDRIIVVDDGSKDESLEIIGSYENEQVRIIRKANGGQLSAFNAALPLIPEASRVFFLDADDVYSPDYLKETLKALSALPTPVDFSFCDDATFTEAAPIRQSAIGPAGVEPILYSNTSALTRHHRLWIGNPTSSLSISGTLLHRILPCPLEADWRTRADDVLIYAASIADSQKVHLKGLHFNYRIHGNNAFFGRQASVLKKLEHQIRLERFFNWCGHQFGYPHAAPGKRLVAEFRAFPKAARRRHSLGIGRRLSWRLKQLFGI